MKPERFGRNLTGISGTGRDIKWDEICFVLFRFLNWYEMFRPFQTERNEIDNLERTRLGNKEEIKHISHINKNPNGLKRQMTMITHFRNYKLHPSSMSKKKGTYISNYIRMHVWNLIPNHCIIFLHKFFRKYY